MAQLDACLDALAVLSLDGLQLYACSYAPTAVSVSRRLTQSCSYGLTDSLSSCCRHLDQGMGAVRRTSTCKLPFVPWHPSGSPPDVTPRPNSSTVILPNLLNSDSSEVTMALAHTIAIFGSVCTELWCRGPPRLLHSDSLVSLYILFPYT